MPPRERMAPPKDSLTLLPCFYFVELPLVAASLLALYVLELTQLLQPPQLGVRCCEAALSKPYVDAADEAVPVLMLRSLAFAGPAATIMVCEAVLYLLRRSAERSINAGGCNFNSFLRRTVRFVGVLVFGLCATALLTDVVQLCTGSHAPFFLTVCKPNCSSSCDSFITQDVCTGHDLDAIQAARKTFPSQHATLSAFAAVYVSMYLNSTVPRSTKLLKPLLVFLFALAAALAGLTQVTQHRSHPCDVYVGFLLGAFVAAYLAVHAVGNFNSSDDLVLAPPPPPPKDDPLRALAERGHDSVYNKGPASASESTDEISAVRVPMECLEGLGLQREQASMGSLKRASVDVELLAPRSPMGKENMVTFSNTLPRASVNLNGDPGATGGAEEPVHLVQPVQPLQPVHPVQPIQRRLKAVQVPMDSLRSQQLVSEWKQRSMELRGVEADREPSEEGSEESSVGTDDGGSQVPVDPPSAQPGRLPPGGAKAVATPRPPQMVDMPPPVSPKSALTRAKWLAIAEKSGGVQPRLLQVVAMSKQHGLLGSSGDHPPSSETTFASSRTSSNPSTKKSCAIISVEAHPAPAVMRSPTPPSASSWDWRSNGSDPSLACDPRLAHHLNRSSSFRPRHASAPGPPEPPEPPLPPEDAEWGGSTNRRRTALVLLDREVLDRGGPHRPVQENYYKKMQGGRRCKDQ